MTTMVRLLGCGHRQIDQPAGGRQRERGKHELRGGPGERVLARSSCHDVQIERSERD
jgi:hypothetical protein